jgi:DnaJ-class molecular chaperone
MTPENWCEACGGNGLEPNFYDPLGPIGSSSLDLGAPSFCLTCNGKGVVPADEENK